MTSLDVGLGPVVNSSGKSSPGIKHGSVIGNPSSVGSVLIGQAPIPKNVSVVGSCSCCANISIQHSGVGSCLVDGEIPGETVTE